MLILKVNVSILVDQMLILNKNPYVNEYVIRIHYGKFDCNEHNQIVIDVYYVDAVSTTIPDGMFANRIYIDIEAIFLVVGVESFHFLLEFRYLVQNIPPEDFLSTMIMVPMIMR